jgi:ribose-phosphate pyrophosphokinase
VTGRATILVCTLSRPDEKILPLLLTAATAKDLGASRVGLVAPYLAYVTCNTVPHASNALDVTDLLADGVREMQIPG